MATLHPRGVNHLALSTCNMKLQLEFWCGVLGCPLKALYWMHGVKNTYHGFVELAPDAYVAFVEHPKNASEVVLGITHAGNPAGPVTAGTLQHVSFNVDSIDDVYAMRDRIRSHGIEVLGPIDHGMTQSMYFAGPEGLTLEICTGIPIDERAWIDPEVAELCGISDEELQSLKQPAPYEQPSEPVAQPRPDPDLPRLRYPKPGTVDSIMAISDQDMWDNASETTPPVTVD